VQSDKFLYIAVNKPNNGIYKKIFRKTALYPLDKLSPKAAAIAREHGLQNSSTSPNL
jgi:hypothetical protein